MNEEEMRYRVTAVVTSTLQIVVQARDTEEAEAFSDAIDFDKWQVLSTEYETVDVAKDYFEQKQNLQKLKNRWLNLRFSYFLKIFSNSF